MLIAGEPSGDLRAAELVRALRDDLTATEVAYTNDSQPLHTGLEPHFFGAGGPEMRAAGVELAVDMMEQSATGIPGLNQYLRGREHFRDLYQLALNRQPDVIIGVDYNYFNLKFAHAIRQHISRQSGWFQDWRPKLVKYISPQVWASRASRAQQIARDYDLMVAIFPFEKPWYTQRVPKLAVQFVGHPLVDAFLKFSKDRSERNASSRPPCFLFLPGSRKGEIKHHMPVLVETLQLIQQKVPNVRARIVSPSELIAKLVKSHCPPGRFEIQVGGLLPALAEADVCISKTGTVTQECMFAGVPTVTFYKTNWITYEFGKRVVTIDSLTLPNIMAREEVFPEFIQETATPENLSRTALELLQDESRRAAIKAKLAKLLSSFGGPGASCRAAKAITALIAGSHPKALSDVTP